MHDADATKTNYNHSIKLQQSMDKNLVIIAQSRFIGKCHSLDDLRMRLRTVWQVVALYITFYHFYVSRPAKYARNR